MTQTLISKKEQPLTERIQTRNSHKTETVRVGTDLRDRAVPERLPARTELASGCSDPPPPQPPHQQQTRRNDLRSERAALTRGPWTRPEAGY